MIREMKKKKQFFQWNREIATYHVMLIPAVVLLLVFSIIPMVGIVIAFQNYIPAKGITGSPWVGMENFTFMFLIPDSMKVFWNTVVIAVLKILAGIIVPVFFALLLNEVRQKQVKKTVQTIAIMPFFLSWVILGNIFIGMFSLDGIINQVVQLFGGEPIMFLGSNTWFQPILVITDAWKNFGYSAIVYLSALTAIDPTLYEAAGIDGATKWKQITRITLPLLVPTIVLMLTLSLGNVLNAGFDQVFNMYNPLVYETGDIIDTYVYRMGLIDMQYSLSTAVGLMKSIVSFGLISLSYILAYRFTGYHIF